MRNKCPYRPPQPPRELCGTTIKWLLGVVSPSQLHSAYLRESPAVIKYTRDMQAYKLKVIRWRISQRTCDRAAWRIYRQHKYAIRKRGKNHGKTNKRSY